MFWKGRWYKPLPTTATTHILKPQIGRLPNGLNLSYSVENEFFCLKLTVALGLPSAAIAIEEFEGNRVLVVERFDRRWTGDYRPLHLPQEDCCQALSVPAALKYESEGGPVFQLSLTCRREEMKRKQIKGRFRGNPAAPRSSGASRASCSSSK
ncbi:HipA domain-containing protein [Bradyrhizobium canariense]|uniref:HipA domain-containing protein n=1 Tax=Bradyrhizobium canariense TaxID=255045 RepID=UPI001F0AE3C3|nr:HipA domain-containing protein [Bradyrhizobium canariense]